MMRHLIHRVLLTISVLAILQCAAFSQSLKSALDIVVQAVLNDDIPGASVLVMQNGNTVVSRAFGVCDRTDQRPFQSDTICWIASLTKPVTAAAAMTLVEQGKLDLDASIDVYLPEFRQQKTKGEQHHPVTVRQLMCHASGIQSSVPLRPQLFFQQSWYDRSLKDIVPAIAKTQLVFEPGTQVQYSNAAPYVLGRIVEIQSGRSFEDYVRSSILEPLGMNDTGFSIRPGAVKKAAVVYRKEDDSAVEFCRYDPQWQVTMTMPDGGLFSTTSDMAKFASAFLSGGRPILSKESVDEMRSQQSEGYGLGWILDEPNQFSHWGSSGTLIWGDRETNTVGAIFIQLQNRKLVAEIHRRFRQAVTRTR
jgi:CubicO group peptidase (beta-lactamase class C family)